MIQGLAFLIVVVTPNAYSFALDGSIDSLDYKLALTPFIAWYPGANLVLFYQASFLYYRT